jgi:predicted dehydrogenase
MVGFTYRRVPALELTRRLVLEGRFGQLTHLRASYLQDWLASPTAEMNWKLNPVSAPLGALSDLGSHVIDLAQFVAGHTVTRLVAVSSLGDRAPLTSEDQNRSRQHPAAGEVQATDRMRAATRGSTQILAQLASGLIASFEVSRTAAGHWNDLRFELAGSEGSIRFRLERLNELELFDRRSPRGEDGFRTILMTDPHHPWLEGWWPPGHIIGWEHAFTHQVAALIEAIAQGQDPHPSFAEGLQIQQVIKAVVTSAETGAWVEVLA